MMSKQDFRKAMAKFATGITIVTTTFNNKIQGMTVNSFMSVSLEPKLITISLDEKTNFYRNIDKFNRIGISVLRKEQKEISMIFAKQIEKTFADYDSLDEVPVIPDALSTLACTVVNTVEVGDHLLVIAEVDKIETAEGEPLIFYNSNYNTIEKKEE